MVAISTVSKDTALNEMWRAYQAAVASRDKISCDCNLWAHQRAQGAYLVIVFWIPEYEAGVGQHVFTGHEYDTDSDLTYAKARYLDQDIGRFYSQDAVFNLIGDPQRLKDKNQLDRNRILHDPQVLNAYSYARNNPLILKDQSGEFPLIPFIGYALFAGAGVKQTESFYENFYLPYKYGDDYVGARGNEGPILFTADAIANFGARAVIPPKGSTLSIDITFLGIEHLPNTRERAGSVIQRAQQSDPLNTSNRSLISNFLSRQSFQQFQTSGNAGPTTFFGGASGGSGGSTNINQISQAVISYANAGGNTTDSGFAAAVRALNQYNSSLSGGGL